MIHSRGVKMQWEVLETMLLHGEEPVTFLVFLGVFFPGRSTVVLIKARLFKKKKRKDEKKENASDPGRETTIKKRHGHQKPKHFALPVSPLNH